jgi:hypothetical protein
VRYIDLYGDLCQVRLAQAEQNRGMPAAISFCVLYVDGWAQLQTIQTTVLIFVTFCSISIKWKTT